MTDDPTTDSPGGAKAVNLYIVVCFVLAAAGAVGYKLVNDRSTELSAEYVHAARQAKEIREVLAPSIGEYYQLVSAGSIERIDAETKANTSIKIADIAKQLRLRDSDRTDDQVDIPLTPSEKTGKIYNEYTLTINLKGVTQSQWASFLNLTEQTVHKYAFITDVVVVRTQTGYSKIAVQGATDGGLWNCTLTITWYGPPQTSSSRTA